MATPRRFRQLRYEVPPGATELVLIRHGESLVQVEGEDHEMLEGQADPPLSPEGRLQADALCGRLRNEKIDAIYVSSLRRTSETAAPLAAAVGLEIRIEPDLREVFLGEWENLFRQKVIDHDPIAIQMYNEQRWELIPGAEKSEDFTKRVRSAVERIASANPGSRVGVFAHGGTIGALLSVASNSEPFAFIAADNASISRIVVNRGRWSVRGFNDVTHLSGL